MCKYKTLGYTGLFSLHIEPPSYSWKSHIMAKITTFLCCCVLFILQHKEETKVEVTTIFKTGEFQHNEAFDANEDLKKVAVLRTSKISFLF